MSCSELCLVSASRAAVAAWLLGASAWHLSAHAQNAEDLQRRSQDEQRRQQEREKARELNRPAPDVKLGAPAADAIRRYEQEEKPCFQISRIQLVGTGAQEFSWLASHEDGRGLLPEADPMVGRCLGVLGIQQILTRLQGALIARGYVTTRVMVEPQALQTGVLKIAVLRGCVESIVWDPQGGRRGSRWNTVPVTPGETLRLQDIEQALENYRRVPTADADIQIAPGMEPGSSVLRVRHQQGFPFRLGVTLDDSGSRSTGKLQASVTFSYDNWWTLSDMAYLAVSRAVGDREPGRRGNGGVVWHYSVPMGYWLLSSTISDGTYHQEVSGLSQTYEYSGVNRSVELKAAKVVLRDVSSKTMASVKVFRRSSNNFIDDTEVEVQRRVVAGLEWGVNHRRAGESGWSVDASLNFRHGTGALDAMRAPEERFGEGTSRMRLWSAEMSVQTPVGPRDQALKYSAQWRGQWEQRPLVPQDMFSLGSRYTVRGFDGRSTLQADRGWLLRQELSKSLSGGVQQAYLALDGGHVIQRAGRPLSGSTLVGAATGLRGQWRGVQFDMFAGMPLRKPQRFETAPYTLGFSLSAGS
ncbi:MAG: ShlB/FhaC/HecB family hemolysin secretion/activation protein [Burkholderiaceae bacterium]|nr:MAG: ShlB/FhaC/HecB family hemolysin secretion/activation protein [Burkholderiaceae bacterium]